MADTQTDHPHSKRDRGQIAMGVRVKNPDDLANYGIDRAGTTIPYQRPAGHQSDDQTDYFLLPLQMTADGYLRIAIGVNGRDVMEGNALPVKSAKLEKLIEELIALGTRIEKLLNDSL